jgi:hypothetical protein
MQQADIKVKAKVRLKEFMEIVYHITSKISGSETVKRPVNGDYRIDDAEPALIAGSFISHASASPGDFSLTNCKCENIG